MKNQQTKIRLRTKNFGQKIPIVLAPLFLCCSPLFGADLDISKLPAPAEKTVSFTHDIQPIFENSCIRCHGAERPKSKFSLVTREAAWRGGENGIAIVPGDSAKSPLIHYVAGLDEDMLMPPSGKGDPLTKEQISLLRAWIDQGAEWGAENAEPLPAFSISPSLRFVSVSGDGKKFCEHFWRRDGLSAGVEHFSVRGKVDEQSTLSLEGRAFPGDEDYKVAIRYDRPEVGFIYGGFEQFQKFYDDSGGFYPFVPPQFSLNRDLSLREGRAWIELGLTLPDRPRVVFGYEYQFREGEKSTLEWGTVKSTSAPILVGGVPSGIERNIYPAAKEIDERTHILKLDASHEIAGVFAEDNFRAEFYDLKTLRENVLSFTQGQPAPSTSVLVNESQNQFRAANTIHLEKEIRDWWFVSGGYLYSAADGEAAFNQNTIHVTGLPVSGDFWKSQAIILSQDSHIFSANARLGPWQDLTFSSGVQSEWTHQQGVGRVSFDSGNPATFLLVEPATLDANLDRNTVQENFALRYTKIPFTSLFAETRLEQESLGQFEDQIGGHHEFVRDTDATSDLFDSRAGFYTAPLQQVSFGGHYRKRYKDSDYSDRVDLEAGGPGDSCPGFIRGRTIDTDEIEAKLSWRPLKWLKSTLTYQRVSTDIDSETDAIDGITPGGPLRAANVDSDVYGINVVLTPFTRWYFSGTFDYYDSRAETAHNNVPSVVPYRGDIYSILLSTTYVLNDKTDLNANYSFSTASYGQNNFAAGLPVGIDYELHGLQAGITRRFKNLTLNLQYGFFKYAEPTSGGFNDYTAHAVFATTTLRWP